MKNFLFVGEKYNVLVIIYTTPLQMLLLDVLSKIIKAISHLMRVMRTEMVKHKRGFFFFPCGLDREANKPTFQISERSKTGAR